MPKKRNEQKQIIIDLDEESLEELIEVTCTSGSDAEADAIKTAIRFTIDNY